MSKIPKNPILHYKPMKISTMMLLVERAEGISLFSGILHVFTPQKYESYADIGGTTTKIWRVICHC